MLTRDQTVDVIIPVYNNFQVVRDCLDSVLRANCKTKFEIVVFNDASSEPNLNEYLRDMGGRGLITLHVNEVNQGFTRTVNAAMKLHTGRDVLLLNSDTIVYEDWLDRIVAGAYSSDDVATVNPLTNANGSHISWYPRYSPTQTIALEVDDNALQRMARTANSGLSVPVYVTVGFCMFIKRACLDDIGYFDAINFPIGYGEEGDFCYRAVTMGWRHLIVGDVFVTHLEGKSFGQRKMEMINNMLGKFKKLHPEAPRRDEEFRTSDPLRAMRARLDLERVKAILGGRDSLAIDVGDGRECKSHGPDEIFLIFDQDKNQICFSGENMEMFPNIGSFSVPRHILRFNRVMADLGIKRLTVETRQQLAMLSERFCGLAFEVPLGPSLVTRDLQQG
jgi:GT2 family glycosyltransferase